MPTWGEVLNQLGRSSESNKYDVLRRRYLADLSAYTGRATILYTTKFVSPGSAPPEMLSINDEDLQGLMEVLYGVRNTSLDLILHSPGGSIDATEGLVLYLRSKFENIRVIVPSLAMSAATMMACAANRIVMGKHSFLGPVDPQFVLQTEQGRRNCSAEEILEQFDLAQKDCADPKKLGAWVPILKSFGPDLLVKCRHACELSRILVQGWLENYMLKDVQGGKRTAAQIAEWLARHANSKSHGRHLSRAELQAKGLIIDNLEDDQNLQDKVLSVFHAANHTFNALPAAKIIENDLGRAYVRLHHGQNLIQHQPGQGFPLQIPIPPEVMQVLQQQQKQPTQAGKSVPPSHGGSQQQKKS